MEGTAFWAWISQPSARCTFVVYRALRRRWRGNRGLTAQPAPIQRPRAPTCTSAARLAVDPPRPGVTRWLGGLGWRRQGVGEARRGSFECHQASPASGGQRCSVGVEGAAAGRRRRWLKGRRQGRWPDSRKASWRPGAIEGFSAAEAQDRPPGLPGGCSPQRR